MSIKKVIFLIGLILFISALIVGEVMFLQSVKKRSVETSNEKKTIQETASNYSVFPDIKKSQSMNQSNVRDEEIAKISPKLPYTDEKNNIKITYYSSSKVLSVVITQAISVADFKGKKNIAEQRLKELGADDLCYLGFFWGLPYNIRTLVTPQDLVVSGCAQFFP